jgi:DNA recombination protein RmuC
MEIMAIVLGVLVLAAGGAAAWLAVGRARLAAEAAAARAESAERLAETGRLRSEAEARAAEADRIREELNEAKSDLRAAEERHRGELSRATAMMDERESSLRLREKELREWVSSRTEEFRNAFAALSGEALKSASGEFLRLAEERMKAQQQAGAAELDKRRAQVDDLVKPIAETLRRTDEKLGVMQSQWAADRGSLTEQLRGVSASGEQLRLETTKLVRALSKPEVRGRYGEIQLKRVAELAGMKEYCDFSQQTSARDEEGRLQRPDMVVRLPNERVIAVDAKTNTLAYLEAIAAQTPEEQEQHLERFARHVSEQVQALSKKQYWAQFEGAPEFVVMFMPGDQFLDAALARRPDLIEQAAGANVLIATPSTLIGLLRAVAVGWREKRLDQQAGELFALGKELHDRAAAAFGYVERLGKALNGAVDRYNEFVGSYERRLEPTLRKFEEAGARGAKELPTVTAVDVKARVVAEAGLLDGPPALVDRS